MDIYLQIMIVWLCKCRFFYIFATEIYCLIYEYDVPLKAHVNYLIEFMKRALYVEDDQNLASTIIQVLNHLNIDVRHFCTGESALVDFEKIKPDLILLDVMLAGKLDGLDVARIIRSKTQSPLLFITCLDETNDINKFLKFSNFDYIHKPFSINEFRLRIHNMISKIVAT